MEERVEEGLMKGSIDSISLEKMEKILNQMKNCICKIVGNKTGTGFFCKILYKNELIPVLMTNYHIIDDNFIEGNKQVNVYINENLKIINLNKENKLYSSNNNEYDLIIIKLKEGEIDNYLEIDQNIFIENSVSSFKDNSIYILHYPNGGNSSVSFGYGIEQINNNDIKHFCNTDFCSSGGPILSLLNNKIIGIHKGCIRKNGNNYNQYNIGTYLKFPLNELNMKKIDNNEKFDEDIKKNENVENLVNNVLESLNFEFKLKKPKIEEINEMDEMKKFLNESKLWYNKELDLRVQKFENLLSKIIYKGDIDENDSEDINEFSKRLFNILIGPMDFTNVFLDLCFKSSLDKNEFEKNIILEKCVYIKAKILNEIVDIENKLTLKSKVITIIEDFRKEFKITQKDASDYKIIAYLVLNRNNKIKAYNNLLRDITK